MTINYVICAAGAGSRFKNITPHVPKPLLKFRGLSSLEWSLRSLPICSDDNLIVITQRQHKVRRALEHQIKERWTCAVNWLEIEGLTRGQLETACLAESMLVEDAPIVIYNCDTYFESKTLSSLLLDTSIEGIIPCSEEQGSSWSFCQLGNGDEVIDIREKERISPWATVGLYYFRSTKKFLGLAHQELEGAPKDAGEYYVAPLYRRYIESGAKVVIDRVSKFLPMGTPEQFETYWGISEADIINSNPRGVIVMDLDNTITIEDPSIAYADKHPNLPVIEKLREYKRLGYSIVIHTARRMRTHNNDQSKVIAEIGEITSQWLARHNVPYDGLQFGKPFAMNGFLVDDRAIRPDEFINLSVDEILSKLG